VNLGSGGLIYEAMQGSKAIRRRGLTTYVSSSCVSACTVVFLGGTQRFVQDGAKLGFHALSAPGFTQIDMASELEKHRRFLLESGVLPQFASKVIQTPPDKMWFPTSEELVAQGVATSFTKGDEFAISGLGKRTPDRAEVGILLQKTRIYQAIKAREPTLYEQLVDITYTALRTGRTLDDVRGDTLPIMTKLYVDSLPYSNREALIRSARMLATEYRALQTAPGRTCIDYAMRSDVATANATARYFSREIQREEQEAMADAIETSDTHRPIPRLEDVQPLLTEAIRIAQDKVGKDAALLGQLSDPTIDPAAACRAVAVYFDALTSLPPTDSERVLRALFATR
jgi:hypothetical protein